jgi:hypothetical protein
VCSAISQSTLLNNKLRGTGSSSRSTYLFRYQDIQYCCWIQRFIINQLTPWSPSWEAASCAVTQEFQDILWNPKIHYRVHKSPPLDFILSQINPVHTTPSYLRSILIVSTHIRLGLPSGPFPYGFPTKILRRHHHHKNPTSGLHFKHLNRVQVSINWYSFLIQVPFFQAVSSHNINCPKRYNRDSEIK